MASLSSILDLGVGLEKEDTGCPKILVIFDTLLFSDQGEQIMKSFDVVIAECGRFFLRYNTHW